MSEAVNKVKEFISNGQKAILINATQAEEIRAAVVDHPSQLFDLDVNLHQ